MTVFENKFCRILNIGTYYVLKSKKGTYNEQYFFTLNEAKDFIGAYRYGMTENGYGKIYLD